jgi:biotin carboxyl carrier protein
MLPDRKSQVRVRANFEGTVEILVRVGQRVASGQALVIIEGDKEIERLSARNTSTVIAVHAKTGEDVAKAALLLELQEDPPDA